MGNSLRTHPRFVGYVRCCFAQCATFEKRESLKEVLVGLVTYHGESNRCSDGYVAILDRVRMPIRERSKLNGIFTLLSESCLS